jgi:hypothetical protein
MKAIERPSAPAPKSWIDLVGRVWARRIRRWLSAQIVLYVLGLLAASLILLLVLPNSSGFRSAIDWVGVAGAVLFAYVVPVVFLYERRLRLQLAAQIRAGGLEVASNPPVDRASKFSVWLRKEQLNAQQVYDALQ